MVVSWFIWCFGVCVNRPNVPRVKMGILFSETGENSVWHVLAESPLTSNKLVNKQLLKASLNVAEVLPVICEVCKCARRISFQFWNIAETHTSRTSRSTVTLSVFVLDCLLSKAIPSLCQLEVLWLHFQYRGTLFKNAPQNRRRRKKCL